MTFPPSIQTPCVQRLDVLDILLGKFQSEQFFAFRIDFRVLSNRASQFRFCVDNDDLQGLATSLSNLGNVARSQGDYEQASDLHQQELAIFQQLGDQSGIAGSLNNLGNIVTNQGEYERATDLYQESLTIYKQLGDQLSITISLNNLGIIARYQGDYERAADLHQQSLDIKQQLGDQHGSAISLNNLGNIAIDQGDYERATDLHQQSLAIRQQLGDQQGIAGSITNIGLIAHQQGDYEQARDLHQQSLTIFKQLGDQQGIATSLSNIGWANLKKANMNAVVALHEGLSISDKINTPWLSMYFIVTFAGVLILKIRLARAAQLLGFVEAHPLKQADLQERIDELMPQLETGLSPDELAQALEQGKQLDLDTVVQELLDEFAPSDEGNTENHA